MKKCIFYLFLALLLLLAGCGKDGGSSAPQSDPTMPPLSDPVLVAEEVDIASLIPKQNNVFQALHSWSYNRATTDYIPSASYEAADHLTSYETNEATIDAYVAMLTEHGFTLIEKDPDPYLYDYRWKLRCDTAPEARILNGYTDTHIAIEGYQNGTFYFRYSGDLQMQDLGLRMDGNHKNLFAVGASAGSGLYKMPDGSFQTADGRLTAACGTATVLRDGVALTGESHRHLNKNEWVYVDEYYRNEDLFFAVTAEYTMSGDVYWLQDFPDADYLFMDDTALNVVIFNNGSMPFFAMMADGKRSGPSPWSTRFDSLFVRVMYYEEDVEAVYYIYAKLSGVTPSEIEVLLAVSMKPQPKEEGDSGSSSGSSGNQKHTCSACGGDGRCNRCGGSGRVNTWTGDSYVMQNCTGVFCSGGRCNQCGGTGKQ